MNKLKKYSVSGNLYCEEEVEAESHEVAVLEFKKNNPNVKIEWIQELEFDPEYPRAKIVTNDWSYNGVCECCQAQIFNDEYECLMDFDGECSFDFCKNCADDFKKGVIDPMNQEIPV